MTRQETEERLLTVGKENGWWEAPLVIPSADAFCLARRTSAGHYQRVWVYFTGDTIQEVVIRRKIGQEHSYLPLDIPTIEEELRA